MVSFDPVIEYFSKSTIHGLSYFGDHERHWIERTFWVVTFIISMFGCFFMVHKTYSKWQQSPIIITQDDIFTPVDEIPFPAVTICPAEKIGNENVNLSRKFELISNLIWKEKVVGSVKPTKDMLEPSEADKARLNITDDDIRLAKAVTLICEGSVIRGKSIELVHSDLKDSEIEDLFKHNKPSYGNTVKIFLVKSSSNFRKSLPWVLTEAGICFTFNSLGNFQIFKKDDIANDFRPYEIDDSGADWSPESGFTFNQTVPLAAFKSDPKDGLVLTLFQQPGSGPVTCPYEMSRIKIIVHSPGEFPSAAQNFFSVPYSHDLFVAVKPVMMTTTADLLGYSTAVRQCYFNHERSLKFYKFYTQNNCEHECYTNFTRIACGCAKLSMPRDNATPFCGPEKLKCLFYSDALARLTRIDGFKNREESLRDHFNLTSEQLKLIATPCKCLPSCVSLDYELSITQSENTQGGDANVRTGISLVKIHFKAASFMKLKRSELYGWGDFIANCGGLLGLFMGVSILSIIELIYYATLRVVCNLSKNKVEDRILKMQPPIPVQETKIVLEPEIVH